MNALMPTLLDHRLNPNSAADDYYDRILRQIGSAFESDGRFELRLYPIRVAFAGDELVLEGEAKDIRAKKLALAITTWLSDDVPVVNHLRVKPTERLSDLVIRGHLIKLLIEEPELKHCLIHSRLPNLLESHRKSIAQPSGSIVADVADGIVTLNGEVTSLAQKRLAGVLAWWAPGCRDVVNGLETVPAQKDSDDEVSCAVRLALEKDPLVNAAKIRIKTTDYVVTLAGPIPNQAMKLSAERDSWSVEGVKYVINRLDLISEGTLCRPTNSSVKNAVRVLSKFGRLLNTTNA
jgi:hypothetical protein